MHTVPVSPAAAMRGSHAPHAAVLDKCESLTCVPCVRRGLAGVGDGRGTEWHNR